MAALVQKNADNDYTVGWKSDAGMTTRVLETLKGPLGP